MIEAELKKVIREIPNFPKQGINFKDISPVLMDVSLYQKVIDCFADRLQSLNIDVIAGVESRGFWFGPSLAQKMQIPFVPVRKKGKLPGNVVSLSYDLEYGSATIEVQEGMLKKGDCVLIHDDLLATGGTALATAHLIEKLGAEVTAFAFLVDLTFLNGEEKLKTVSQNIISLVKY